MLQESHFWVYIQRIEIRILMGHLYSHDLCSIMHNNQDVETTEMFINRQMDKEKLANTCSCAFSLSATPDIVIL